jgi:hypothetical protein
VAAQTQTAAVPASKDNTLYFSTTGALSNGLGTRMFSGNTGGLTGGQTRRALLAFDVAGTIPRHSTIISATLTLTAAMGSTAGNTVTLHRVLQNWGEGTSLAFRGEGGGAASTNGDATWIHTFFPGSLWQTAGGDFTATASSSTTVSTFGAQTWASTPQLVADVQSWLDSPNQNFGWLVRGVESGLNTAIAFETRQTITPANAPRLDIVYTPPAASAVSVGTGCAQGGPTPLTLGAIGLPQVPNPSFAFTVTGGPAGGFGVIAIALDLAPVPLPLNASCFLYVNPTTFLLSLNAPPSPLPFPVPGNPNLLGLDLAMQAVYVAPATLNLASSNALAITLGQ